MMIVTTRMSIGDFSRATHLTVKTLRHYHEIGLLTPADVDPYTGYRRYGTEQLATAQVVRRLRDLGMPLEEIRAVLAAPSPEARNGQIAAHLARLTDQLESTQRAVGELRDLLVRAAPDNAAVELRAVPQITAAAVTDVIDAADGPGWLQGALGELHATLTAQQLTPAGPGGGIYADEIFTDHRGQVTVFLPCGAAPSGGAVRPVGRVRPATIPAAELAVTTHRGPAAGVDRSYGALASYVTRHAIGVPGPIREYYLIGQRDTADPGQWRTEIGWPVFRVR
jgi:DNA-binding transcriptional MerR regulator/effector-binding domain-containing protein